MKGSEIVKEKRQFFRNLFNFDGPSPGYALRVEPPTVDEVKLLSSDGIEDRAQMGKSMLEYDIRCLREIGDDRVPMLWAWSGTEVFAAAYGCPVHITLDGAPFALPLLGIRINLNLIILYIGLGTVTLRTG
ncbi:MAG: hypothetical protein GXO71_05565 [Caldiserica bacterium]|nr:hypothetical protein [Caldisericota bacterium]